MSSVCNSTKQTTITPWGTTTKEPVKDVTTALIDSARSKTDSVPTERTATAANGPLKTQVSVRYPFGYPHTRACKDISSQPRRVFYRERSSPLAAILAAIDKEADRVVTRITTPAKHIMKPSAATSFKQLLEIAERGAATPSFWGFRNVSVIGLKGLLSIDDLAERTMQILQQKKYAFSEKERAEGNILVEHINRMYREHDDQYYKSNIYTQILTIFIKFASVVVKGGDLRLRWKGIDNSGECRGASYYGEMSSFDFYNTPQFKNKFGFNPEEACEKDYFVESVREPKWKRMQKASAIVPRWKSPIWMGKI